MQAIATTKARTLRDAPVVTASEQPTKHDDYASLRDSGIVRRPSGLDGPRSPNSEAGRHVCRRLSREDLLEGAVVVQVNVSVAVVIHRALTARRPRVRYTVGAESRLVPLGRRLLPDVLVLKLIRSHFRI